jgi:predicted GNAT family acetyltransferase
VTSEQFSAGEVVDNAGRRRFEVTGDNGHVAELIYQQVGDRLVLIHTEVPPSFRGQGIGGRLVRAAVHRAERDHLTLIPRCPYARRWLKEHRDDAAGVRIDWEVRRGA